MKLQLKHLSPYLPYGLKFTCGEYDKYELYSLSNDGFVLFEPISESYLDYDYFDNSLKPLLHPLSRLTEPILDGNTPIDWLQDEYFTLTLDEQCKRILEDERWINHCDWLLIQHLFEWHFDVFGLIEKGLAEPIETSKAKGE